MPVDSFFKILKVVKVITLKLSEVRKLGRYGARIYCCGDREADACRARSLPTLSYILRNIYIFAPR